MSKKSSYSGKIGFFSLLGLTFIILKLCHVINWSWWLVLLPLYGGLALIMIIFSLLILFAICVGVAGD